MGRSNIVNGTGANHHQQARIFAIDNPANRLP
jgi:hypothetical protein